MKIQSATEDECNLDLCLPQATVNLTVRVKAGTTVNYTQNNDYLANCEDRDDCGCNCDPCEGSTGDHVLICRDGVTTLLPIPTGDATLKFNSTTGKVVWLLD